ncbi:MAG: aminomethyl-transferring glycine dehydrogenase subunit GcvPB [Elusimicrobia bacterium]|nr:aminomethyl-transferring glycine dehydrogenase subunit GcvPB [Elusimicrobiota bacterium]
MKTIFEKGRAAVSKRYFPDGGFEEKAFAEKNLLRSKPLALPELSELDVVRHYTRLSAMNFSVDKNFYPLGSCTMKYNPKILEKVALLEGFSNVHPVISILPNGAEVSRGCLEVLAGLKDALLEITGMDDATLQPLAGAHGELTGMMIVSAYHKSKGDRRKFVIVPDSSHGTNPASSVMAGYEVLTVATDEKGEMDFEEFKAKMSREVAVVMMTVPNTLGIFNRRIKEVCDLARSFGALMYYDGANLNAVMGKVRPGDIGFDIVHINIHKTFASPHGGGGPGAGPVCVKEHLAKFLPSPVVSKTASGKTFLEYPEKSIGRVAPFFGNFSVLLKGFAYILLMGGDGLEKVSETAVLNANYILSRLRKFYRLPYERRCMHECVLSAVKQKEKGVSALDIAKFLIDRGFHPPTIYFPLIVDEAMMIEPTETENKQTLDEFIDALIDAARLAESNPNIFHSFPTKTPVRRLDEVCAARNLKIVFEERNAG